MTGKGATPARRILWSPLPTPTQARLLRLLTAPAIDARSFQGWADEVAIERLDHGSAHLLPALYLRLSAAGIDHPWLPIMRGWYRRTLYRNRLLVHRGLAVIEALQARGIESLLLKGSALTIAWYGDLGARLMADVDLLLPEETSRAEVAAALAAAGRFTLRNRSLHADTYADADGFEYDLHRYLQPELAYPGSTRGLWKRAQPIAVEGRPLRTLAAEDHVFHAAIHGMRMSDVPPLRWSLDILTILARKPGFDWPTLTGEARRLQAATPLGAALAYLVEAGFLGEAAREACAGLARPAEPSLDRLLYRGLMRPPSLAYSFFRPWLLYRRLSRLSRGDAAGGFRTFLAELWNLPDAGQVPAAALGRVAAKLRLRA